MAVGAHVKVQLRHASYGGAKEPERLMTVLVVQECYELASISGGAVCCEHCGVHSEHHVRDRMVGS